MATETQITPAQRVKLVLDWLEALESGKYRQGWRVLHNTMSNTWCCLGVACDVISDRIALERTSNDLEESFNGIVYFLPDEATAALGLNDRTGSTYGKTLTSMNDWGTSFPQIAAFIRSMPPGLFVPEMEELLRPHLQPK